MCVRKGTQKIGQGRWRTFREEEKVKKAMENLQSKHMPYPQRWFCIAGPPTDMLSEGLMMPIHLKQVCMSPGTVKT